PNRSRSFAKLKIALANGAGPCMRRTARCSGGQVRLLAHLPALLSTRKSYHLPSCPEKSERYNPIPLHWSAKEAAAALHALEQLEQLEHAIRQAYATELQDIYRGTNDDATPLGNRARVSVQN